LTEVVGWGGKRVSYKPMARYVVSGFGTCNRWRNLAKK